jgi:hypothetical protein
MVKSGKWKATGRHWFVPNDAPDEVIQLQDMTRGQVESGDFTYWIEYMSKQGLIYVSETGMELNWAEFWGEEE